MHLSRVDLNLFMVFDAIYTEGSITRAAERLSLTQPAVSHALARLRNTFNDELFVRSGRQMVPTPVARAMSASVQGALSELQNTLVDPLHFDPGQSAKHVSLGMRDIVESVLLPELMKALHCSAPQLTVSSARIQRQSMESELAAGNVDLAFDVLLPIKSAIEHATLMEDRFAVVVRKDHPLAQEPMTVARYLAYRHIVVSSRREGIAIEDFELSRQGIRRDIALRCQHYYVAWRVVKETSMVLTVPERYARYLHSLGETVVLAMPVDLPALEIHMYWHKTVSNDPANSWLRALFLSMAREQARAQPVQPNLP